MALSVTSPSGRTWIVRRRLVPRAPRWPRPLRRRRPRPDRARPWLDSFYLLPAEDDDLLVAILIGIGLLAGLVLVAVPLLIFLFDLLVIGLVVLAGIGARILFRRPWVVEARTDGPPAETLRWRVVGWRRSGEMIEQVAGQLAAGGSIPAELGPPA